MGSFSAFQKAKCFIFNILLGSFRGKKIVFMEIPRSKFVEAALRRHRTLKTIGGTAGQTRRYTQPSAPPLCFL
jgi:hypothetical protein